MSGFHKLEDIWVTALEIKILAEKIATIGMNNLMFS